jgi:hypothetical protein
MKEIVLTVFGGIGLLIFAYLLFAHGDSAVALLNSGGGQLSSNVKVLQGR